MFQLNVGTIQIKYLPVWNDYCEIYDTLLRDCDFFLRQFAFKMNPSCVVMS
jgi:hypothetical protein